MKITGKKDMAAERQRGRAAIDAVYVPRINAAMGPKFALYQAKARLADAKLTMSTSDNAEDILDRFHLLMRKVADVESERQDFQSRIDTAQSAAEIDAIIASL